MTSNRALLEKADLAIADLTAAGGYLKPSQAKRFMRLLIKQSALLQLATVVPMAAPSEEISRIKFGSRVLRPGREAVALTAAERAKPDLSRIGLDTRIFKAEVRLSDEVLEDNIEQGELRQTIMELLSEAIARDMEEIVINGNVASTDVFLAQMDGVLVQAQSNVVDAAGAVINKDLLNALIKSLPSEYLRDKSSMRYLTSVDAELDYRNTLAERSTAIGDKFLEGDAPVLYSGVPLQPIPMWPENLGTTADRTAIVLTNPKNVYVGIWRQIRIETDRDISEGVLKIVATLRFGTRFGEEQAVAKAVGVAL
jgi:HK97 family phage major capsid protein